MAGLFAVEAQACRIMPAYDEIRAFERFAADLVARADVIAIEGYRCDDEAAGSIPFVHDCEASLRVRFTRNLRSDGPLPQGETRLRMPFASSGYAVAAGDAVSRIAAGLTAQIVVMASATDAPGDRSELLVVAGPCTPPRAFSADSRIVSEAIEKDAFSRPSIEAK